MIEDQAHIERIAHHARASGSIAIDTEFMGEGRYRTLLCLIQIAVPTAEGNGADGGAIGGHAYGNGASGNGAGAGNGAGDGVGWAGGGSAQQHIELLDPLAGGLDASPLAHVLADPKIEVVLHAGRQDVALLRRALRTEVTNVFDTQLAAGFTGLAAQRSYDSLLTQVLGVKLSKSASFTRWDARPLTAEQLSYAKEDVVHLLELAHALKRRLTELGRLQWAMQECQAIAAASDERDLLAIFERLPRIGSASPAAQEVAKELVQWRERTAERQDRPVQTVLSDAALVEIAKRTPGSVGELSKIRGVQQSVIRRSGEQIVEQVERGKQRPPQPRRFAERGKPPEPEDAPIVALLEALARTRAREADLAYELIATKAELQSIVAAKRLGEPHPDVRVLTGWRRELVGEELLRLLAGGVSLSVQEGLLRVRLDQG